MICNLFQVTLTESASNLWSNAMARLLQTTFPGRMTVNERATLKEYKLLKMIRKGTEWTQVAYNTWNAKTILWAHTGRGSLSNLVNWRAWILSIFTSKERTTWRKMCQYGMQFLHRSWIFRSRSARSSLKAFEDNWSIKQKEPIKL